MDIKVNFLFIIIIFSIKGFSQAWIEGDTLLCFNGSGSATITSGQFYDAYQWYYKPINSSNNFLPIIGANSPTLFYDWQNFDQTMIKVHVSYNFQGTLIEYDSNTLIIDSYDCNLSSDFFDKDNFSLAPNPNNGFFWINTNDEVLRLEIFNFAGQIVYSSIMFNPSLPVDITFLSKGIYLLKINFAENSKTLKLIKQ